MANKLNLEVEALLNKRFDIDVKGYNAEEVDTFLDLVIEDYQTYQQILVDLNRKVSDLEHKNATLLSEMIQIKNRANFLEDPNGSISNVDVLKRLSKLEQEVFKNKHNS